MMILRALADHTFQKAYQEAEEALRAKWAKVRSEGRWGKVTVRTAPKHQDLLLRTVSSLGGLEQVALPWRGYLDQEISSLTEVPTHFDLNAYSFYHSAPCTYAGLLGSHPTNYLYSQLFYPFPESIRGLVVICHGYGENRRSWHPTMVRLAESGMASLVYDQRGAGCSSFAGNLADPEGYLADFLSLLTALPALMQGIMGSQVPIAALGFSAGASLLLQALYNSEHYPEVRKLVGCILINMAVFGSEKPSLDPHRKGGESKYLLHAERSLKEAHDTVAQSQIRQQLPPERQLVLLSEFGLDDRVKIMEQKMEAARHYARLGYEWRDGRWCWSNPRLTSRVPLRGFGNSQALTSNTAAIQTLLGPEHYEAIEIASPDEPLRMSRVHFGITNTPEGWEALRQRVEWIFSKRNDAFRKWHPS